MQKFIVAVLSIGVLLSSSTPVVAATYSNYWNYSFSSSKKRYPVTRPATTTPTAPVTTPPTSAKCTTGWYVTGYFTPVEADYTGATEIINVKGSSYAFNVAFLKEVQTEGWGKTKTGKYIGYYSNAWHFAPTSLDAKGNPLNINTVAIDPSLISFGTKLQITTLSQGFGTKTFTATDIGTGVKGKHIDVYTGEGSGAKAMTFKITGNNNTVCTQ